MSNIQNPPPTAPAITSPEGDKANPEINTRLEQRLDQVIALLSKINDKLAVMSTSLP